MVKQWEEFPFGPKHSLSELHVTLSRKGEIMVGAAACEKMGKPNIAVLLFDRVNSLIGVQPASTRAKNGHPLITKAGARHRVIRANSYCRHYGIKVDRTIAFNAPEVDEDGVLVLSLKNTRTIGKA